jgi:hypothetical protein
MINGLLFGDYNRCQYSRSLRFLHGMLPSQFALSSCCPQLALVWTAQTPCTAGGLHMHQRRNELMTCR